MPAIRDIMIHLNVEHAIKMRKCRRTKKHKVAGGDPCLVVKTGPMNKPYAYCAEHAKPMLDSAWHKLRDMYAFLNLTPPKG